MYTNELDLLPQQTRQGILSKEKAAMKVMETLYVYPARFNLQNMDEDERSEFLIDMLPKFASLIERHNDSISPFGAYLYHSVPGLKLTWAKKRFEMKNAEFAMKKSVKDIYERKEERTLLAVAMPKSLGERRQQFLANKSDNSSLDNIFERSKRGTMSEQKIRQKRSAIILALKSAWYLDEKHIDQISEYCGCSRDDIERKIQKVRKSLVEKSKRHANLEERRDRAWYFICKYREQLARMNSNTKSYEAQKRKLQYQIRSWKTKNAQLKKHAYKISPDNDTVAKALNVPTHKVTLYLNYAKRLSKNQEMPS